MKRRNDTAASQAPGAAESISPSPGHVAASSIPLPESLLKWPGFLLAWVAHLAGEVYAQGLAPLRIKPHHLGILTLLESEGPMVQARLSDRLTIVKPVVVGLINELEARGFVERRPHPTDRRAFEIHLLDPGRRCISDAEAISHAVTANFFGALSPDEQQTLHQLLWRLASSNSQGAALPAKENNP